MSMDGKKETLDWDSRQRELKQLLEQHRKSGEQFDCLVPVSGGKDGSYVSYKLKQREFGISPRCR